MFTFSHTSMDQNLKLVMELKKYEFLYNHKMPEYTKKDLVEKAWKNIAAKMELPVIECKDKWKNIRTAFLRTIKSKRTRPYYLSEELQFIVPYFTARLPGGKTRPKNDNTDSANVEQSSDSENFFNIEDMKFEFHDEPINIPVDTQVQGNDEMNNDCHFESDKRRRRKLHNTDEIERNFLEYLKLKKQKISTQGAPTLRPIEHFFQSLMPDMESMTQDQLRHFKIEVLMLIDRIKNSP